MINGNEVYISGSAGVTTVAPKTIDGYLNPNTPSTLAVSGTSAELSADLAAGRYRIRCTCDVTYQFTRAGGGGSATWLTAPGIFLAAGDTDEFIFSAGIGARIAAVTGAGAGPSGTLFIIPIV